MAERSSHIDEKIRKLKWFQAQVLPLDFYKDIVDDQKSEKKFAEVPLGFENEKHYIDTFIPLLMEEVKMQIHRCKDTDPPLVSEEVTLSLNYDDKEKADDAFRVNLARKKIPTKKREMRYSVGDLILISQSESAKEETDVHMLGWMEQSIYNELKVLVMPGNLKTDDKDSRAFKILQRIAAGKPWYATYVFSMNTCVREFEGLMALPRIPLRELLVNNFVFSAANKVNNETPSLVPEINKNSASVVGSVPDAVKNGSGRILALPDKIEDLFKSRYNAMQQQAIKECRKLEGITLIQGPPGTGKTTTILGILSMLLNARASVTDSKRSRPEKESESEDELESEESIHERKRQRLELLRLRAPWFRGGYVPWADTIEQQLPTRLVTAPYPKIASNNIVQMYRDIEVKDQKVLVCAPSNAAIDEVLRKSDRDGIVDEDGIARKPSIVRIGPNLHQDLQKWGLDKQAEKNASNPSEKEEEKARIMRAVRIVCATLSTSGSRDVAGAGEEFDTVIIDEASQGVEMSTLVPLKLGCRRLILVGDPKQLPATVFSNVALSHKYDQSLFQRLAASEHPVTMLNEQFRMHPAISVFPSKRFYEGRLKDGRDKETFEREFPAPWSKINCFGRAVFFHLKGSMEKTNMSFTNQSEARFVVSLYAALAHVYPPEQKWRSRFAIISPYAEQVKLLRTEFRIKFGFTKENFPIDINTVDGFQGREKDIVIVSTVRGMTPKHGDSIGFVRDKRRMNVAFSRARLNLWVVGHANILQQNPDWAAFLEMQQEQCSFMRVSVPHETFFGRYLNGWYERHPESEKPDLGSLLDESNIAEVGETGDDVVVSEPECGDVDESRAPDVEDLFTSDDDSEDAGHDDHGAEHQSKIPEAELVDEGDGQPPDDAKDDDEVVDDE